MGVPKFFRYTSERYPCLNELVKQYQIPDFDNMYLDMNGIIHNCSHPDDSNPHFRITEEKIFKDIFHYISILFQIIKPKKLFFMAIDGVAPRAKMNQQRGRRFRSAREAEKLEEEAKAKGEVLPSEKRFDSNCITPGTVFMARLHEQLKYFVKMKISTDPLWSKVKVILTGHETPGEGEHKIMDYIRWSRSQPDYDPNTRHCLYGLDADLIMLGMCTHEPHFALLREEVKFGKNTQRATSPEETNFYLLHLSLLRQYLEQEFISIKDKLPFEYDLEKIVDDWVLMGFLVGNDFIPNLPNMHINNDALPLLYKTYLTVLPTLDGYINEAGDLHLERFETFMQELAKIDKEKFQDTYADLKYFEGKTGRRPNDRERKEYKPNNDETFNVNIDDIKANKPDDELQALINATQEMFVDDIELDGDDEFDETSDEEANIEMEFIMHKKDYYMNKLDYSKVTEEVLADQAECYVRAIQWNLYYYYKGCPSWCWYYPHHYAPYISDIKGFKDLKFDFELGEPFKPFEQLLAVLPASSKHLLPTPFHDLMTDEDSPIVHYYPINFETDLNGKRNDWEAVVLIPFIDETNLLSAMIPCYQRLTEAELQRNTHGPILVYNWTSDNMGVALAPDYFPPVQECHASEQAVWRTELDVPEDQLQRGMLPNAKRDFVFPGFPTMRHLKYQTCLKKCRVKVFDQPSRNESMIVQVLPEESTNPPLEKVASELLGKVIWAGWPHLTRAKVISVSNEKFRLHHINKQNNNSEVEYSTEKNEGNMHKQWISERSTVIEHNMNRLGIELGDVHVLIHAVNLKGYKYIIQDNTRMVLEEDWCTMPCGYALQAIVPNVKCSQLRPPTKFYTPAEAYPPGDSVFLLTQGQYYGCLATVVSSDSVRSGRIKVCVTESIEPSARVRPHNSYQYRTAHHAAAACGISPQMLSRITGSVLVILGPRTDLPTETQSKINIGLNLKFNKKNEEVAGYTRRCGTTNTWLYTERCVQLVTSYAQHFPELFDKLAYSLNRDVFYEGDLWPEDMGTKIPQTVQKWLKSQPHTSAVRRDCGSEVLEPEEMKALWSDLEQQLAELRGSEKKVTLHVKWNLLYKPELHEGNTSPDDKATFELYDRVVCVSPHMTVPLAATGTVTAVYPPAGANTVRLADKLNARSTYQVMFDKPFPGALVEDLFEEARFYRMSSSNLLNLSFGRKLRPPPSGDVRAEAGGVWRVPPTAVLRRDSAHHSAFASYSPPRDTKPAMKNPHEVAATSKPDTPKDDPTILLKSLLKISENETDQNKQKKSNEKATTWRNQDNTLVTPPHKSQPQQTWRRDADMSRPPANYNERSNIKYKNAPPLPPYPTFPQQFPGPLLPPNYNNYNSYNNGAGSQRSHKFPQHLPVVNNTLLAPSYNKPQHQNPQAMQAQAHTNHVNLNPNNMRQPHNERVTNPFVPLQVQTRRANHSGRNIDSVSALMTAPASTNPHTLPKPQPQSQAPQNQHSGPRRPKTKKPRIAANLPFQME
ncbi:unnamed protein product [Leptidea sinapis]|uniref:5'-3' exoribonuclease 1 n=1 Tax=Leptidea sinapis TaxID=189913 RepID=A0A5E4R3Y9_9NEOP|nr:unnamed protein product [Leptidea sinapis]